MKQRKLYVFQHVDCEGPGAVGRAAGEYGLALERFQPARSLPAGEEAAGLLILGGPMGVYEAGRHPWIADESACCRRFVDSGKPVLGICLGSQILASALGARVYPHERKEIGWGEVSLESAAAGDPLLGGLPSPFKAFHWHGDTFDLPAGSVHLARSKVCANQIFRFGASAWGFQCHFEVERDDPLKWAGEYRDEVRKENAPTIGEDFHKDTEAYWPPLQPVAETIADRFIRLCVNS